MSDGASLAKTLVSHLGAPRDYTAEFIGGGIVLIVLIAYGGFEIGLVVVLRKLWRIVATGSANGSDQS